MLANEEVDLPVFFFIDKDVLDDPSVREVRDVVLSYSFFGARRNETSGQLEPDTDLSKVSNCQIIHRSSIHFFLVHRGQRLVSLSPSSSPLCLSVPLYFKALHCNKLHYSHTKW